MSDEPINLDNLWIKCLRGDRATYTGVRWPMPTGEPDADGWTVGPWTPKRRPVLCGSGWHALADTAQLLDWGLHQDVWLCEVRGKSVIGDNKAAWEQARLVWRCPWDDTSRQLFAADCAERALPIFEKQYPRDDRPRRAIEAARQFARGEIGWDELHAAARAATAAYAAAAAYASRAAAAAYADAYAATYAAADAAASSRAAAAAYADASAATAAAEAVGVGRAAARQAERRWQADRLAHYLGLEP